MAQHLGKRRYEELRARLTQILNEEDPVGLIRLGAPLDEYDPEVGTVLPRLKDCLDESGLRRVLHEEFARWFGPETAGSEQAYARAAERIWAVIRDERVV